MKNSEHLKIPTENNLNESACILVDKKWKKFTVESKKNLIYEICIVVGVVAVIFLLFLYLACYDYKLYDKDILIAKATKDALDTSKYFPSLNNYDGISNDVSWEIIDPESYNNILEDSKERFKRDTASVSDKINEIQSESGIYEKRKADIKTRVNTCRLRFDRCRSIINLINSQVRSASNTIESVKEVIDKIKPNSENPSTQELYECLACQDIEGDVKKIDSSSSGSRPYKFSGDLERSRGQNVNHVVNVFTNDKAIEIPKVDSPPQNNKDIQTTVLVSKSNTSTIQDGTKITQVIRNKTIVERRSENSGKSEESKEPIKFSIPLNNNVFNQVKIGKNHNYNDEDLSRMTTRDTTSYQDQRFKDQRNNFNAKNPSTYQPNRPSSPKIYGPQIPPSEPSNPVVIPTAENSRSSQQLLFNPYMMYSTLCYPPLLSAPMSTNPRMTSAGVYPGAFPYPGTFNGPVPPQNIAPQGLYPTAQTGYAPYVHNAQAPFGDQKFEPSGPGNYPGYGYSNMAQQSIPCSWVSMPLYQFPGPSAELQRIGDPANFRPNQVQFNQPSFRDSAWRESSNSAKQQDSQDCKPNYFKCLDNGACIPIFHRCDGNVDCPDASDERTCSCKDRITKDKLCDGYFDCPRGEDELGCFGCGVDSFSCQDWSKRKPHGSCVQLSERCDGISHCTNSKDEIDCSILTQSFIESQDLFTIGYSSGYLFKNWQGKWYPVCTPTMPWAIESCAAEVGTSSKQTPEIKVESIIRGLNQDSYIAMKPSGQIEIVSDCDNKVIFVRCPPIPCGTRVFKKHDTFKPYGIYEDTLVASQHLRNSANITLNNTYSNYNNSNNNNTSEMVELTKADGRSMGSRVVGGRASEPQAWPFLVAIYRDGYFQCGGVIVDEKWILTAAHCVEELQAHYYQIQAGLLRRFSFSPMGQTRQARFIIPHPDYNRNKMTNDLALIRLNEPLRFNRWIRATCLPRPQWGNQPIAGDKCTTVGWGATVEHGPDPDDLREVEVPILSQCKRAGDHYEGVVCAGYPDGGKDACQGDSGGPLMCKVQRTETQWYVAGVVSHGEGCARPNEPGAYTRVSHYTHWINNTMNLDHTPFGSKPLAECPGFTCHTGLGKCLPNHRRCDQNVDCIDAEDEINCENVRKETNAPSFRKTSNQLIYEQNPEISGNAQNQTDPQSAHWSPNDANMEIGDDDDHSHNNEKEVKINDYEKESTTGRGEAITETNKITTETTTDDSELSVTTEISSTTLLYPDDLLRFTCSRLTQTISMGARCNKIIDCEDGTDETECTCKDFLMISHPSSVCDGRIDCADETDENDCDFCNNNQFACTQSSTCIPKSKRCDKINDCPLQEDELDCYALTDGTYIGVDFNGYPILKYKGVVTNLTNEKWRPVCYDVYNANLNNKNYLDSFCQNLGFREHKTSNLRQVPNTPLKVESKVRHANDFIDDSALQSNNQDSSTTLSCYGLNIHCELIFNRSTETFAIKNPFYQNQTYLWPWEAAIFVDGSYHCPAVLLNDNWALASSRCTKNVDLKTNYTVVLAGLSLPYKYVDGPYQQISEVKQIDNLVQLEGSMLRINLDRISRYIQPVFFDRRFYPATINDECIAIGTDTKFNTKMVFLQPILDDCPPCHRCFISKIHEDCPKNNTAGDWSGTVTCRGPNGWYPAAIFHEKDMFCEFHTVQSLTSIDYMYAHLMKSMGESTYIPHEYPPCDGKRCSLGNCVTWDRICDGIQDCRDGTDENSIVCNEKQDVCEYSSDIKCECAQSELKCKNGMCVSKEKFCDGYADCSDGSDEPEHCTCAGYLELTHPERLCDNVRHCFDKSDENHEQCFCEDASFKCINSTEPDGGIPCISQDFVCDGEEDCANGEDEKLCRIVKGTLKDPHGTGEILRRSYGVWHSECFSAAVTTDVEAEKLCQSMGYANGTILSPEEKSGYRVALMPLRDNFYIIRLNHHMVIAMRDNKPLISLATPTEDCFNAHVKCL